MEKAKIINLYTLEETIAGEYLAQFTYPWEALAGIGDFIRKLGPTLDKEKPSGHLDKHFQSSVKITISVAF